MPPPPPDRWQDALLVASLIAADPIGCGGVVLRGRSGPVRDAWLAALRDLLPEVVPLRRVPVHITDDRLLGGLDLAATLDGGKPVVSRGLLAEANGGLVVLSMSERWTTAAAARVALAMDRAEVRVARDGTDRAYPTRFGVIALDEGIDDERTPAPLLDRLAFHVDLDEIALGDITETLAARGGLPDGDGRPVAAAVPDGVVEALCSAALALGVDSLRVSQLAVRVARIHAFIAGRDEVGEEDAAVAARLVLAPRATRLPSEEAAEPPPPEATESDPPEAAQDETVPPEEPPRAETSEPSEEAEEPESRCSELDDQLIAAAAAALPEKLLERLRSGDLGRDRANESRGQGARRRDAKRGRRVGVKRGDPRVERSLNVFETLRTAAPWQAMRRSADESAGTSGAAQRRLRILRDDLRFDRFEDRAETTTIFVVDASGSTALQRLAEVKGAIELILAECYARRDRVALVSFRDREAQVLLPPTRSLVHAKRSLAGLPGGGGTPLAMGIDSATSIVHRVRSEGGTPIVVLLTDGSANIARDGSPGRARAREDAIASAHRLRSLACACLLVDVSPRPRPDARDLASELAATYLALPHANSAQLRDAVQDAGEGLQPAGRVA